LKQQRYGKSVSAESIINIDNFDPTVADYNAAGRHGSNTFGSALHRNSGVR
jgi:hypothetical protein